MRSRLACKSARCSSRATDSARRRPSLSRLAAARRGILAAAAIGIVFVALKATDYSHHASNGHGFGDGPFWDAYVLATGFHFAHVVLGTVMLISVGRKIGKTTFPDSESAIAGLALFWHMCDVAWFFLFPLFFAPVVIRRLRSGLL